jgi:hypothetical protein
MHFSVARKVPFGVPVLLLERRIVQQSAAILRNTAEQAFRIFHRTPNNQKVLHFDYWAIFDLSIRIIDEVLR